MSWKLAPALKVLLEQVNVRWPNRQKEYDGTIGDEAHQHRKSDHNPNAKGIVLAMDLDNDPANGLVARRLGEALIASRDPRIKYVISNGQICNGDWGVARWMWRSYSGSNPHNEHMHISLKDIPELYNEETPWRFDTFPQQLQDPFLKQGMEGDAVKELQDLLIKSGIGLTVDGKFGSKTKAAVEIFQRSKGLVVDGLVGKLTWRALRHGK